jgi:hypothetical protein
MRESEIRRMQSINILIAQNVPVNVNQPEIEDTQTSLRRSTEEVAFRAMALGLVAAKADDVDHETLNQLIEKYQLRNQFTEKENDFIHQSEPDEASRINFLWRYESYWLLLWALNFVKQLDFPRTICDLSQAIPLLMTKQNSADFITQSRLRPQSEILDQADLIYRYHWAVVENSMNAQPPPSNLDAGVVYERHYALNWLIGYSGSDWDNISTDT